MCQQSLAMRKKDNLLCHYNIEHHLYSQEQKEWNDKKRRIDHYANPCDNIHKVTMGQIRNIISMEEILQLYNACGLTGRETPPIRFSINTGPLDNKLNTGSLDKQLNTGKKEIFKITMTNSITMQPEGECCYHE